MKKNLLAVIFIGLALSLTSCGFKGKEKTVYDLCMSIERENAHKGIKEIPAFKTLDIDDSSKKSACKSLIKSIRAEAKAKGESKDKLLDGALFIFSLASSINSE